jgi:hypothetical protein
MDPWAFIIIILMQAFAASQQGFVHVEGVSVFHVIYHCLLFSLSHLLFRRRTQISILTTLTLLSNRHHNPMVMCSMNFFLRCDLVSLHEQPSTSFSCYVFSYLLNRLLQS